MKVMVIPQKHYSIPKAIDLLGGPSQLLEIEHINTDQLRMSTTDLEKKIFRAEIDGVPIMAIIAIAGETETGLVDPLGDIARISRKHHIFSIADGAFGASYRLSRNKHVFAGLHQFDAIIWDPHKTGYVPYSCGFVGFKNVGDHIELGKTIDAPYIAIQSSQEDDERTQRGRITQFMASDEQRVLAPKRLEGSMGAGPILSVLATKKTLGAKGLAIIYDLTLDRISYLYDRINTSSYLLPVHRPNINVLCFRLRPHVQARLGNEKIAAFITRSRLWLDNNIVGDGGYYFSDTILKLDGYTPRDESTNLPVWRAVIMNPWTTDTIINQAITGLEGYIQRSFIT